MRPGRYCDLNNIKEERALRAGMDFRRPEYRREVFLRFYDFHLHYRSHPGAVYYVIPALRRRLGWTNEQAYWFAFINGNTQNPVTSYAIWEEFPALNTVDLSKLTDFMNANWSRLEWDTDRRYFKAKFVKSVENYLQLLSGVDSQEQFFDRVVGLGSEEDKYDRLWSYLREYFYGFGRLSAWSYSEYLRIIGLQAKPRELFLRDIDGSKSHRNGLCKVLGRDDLDWREGPHPYTPEILDWLEEESHKLLAEIREHLISNEVDYVRDVNFLTLESTLCCYKSWHRPNRRYPNVYNDMFHDRIKKAEKAWGRQLRIFWDIRRAALPQHLRLEDNLWDVGVKPEKQNHYRLTGQVIMMGHDEPCFANDYDRRAM
jgi:hypothetical protein